MILLVNKRAQIKNIFIVERYLRLLPPWSSHPNLIAAHLFRLNLSTPRFLSPSLKTRCIPVCELRDAQVFFLRIYYLLVLKGEIVHAAVWLLHQSQNTCSSADFLDDSSSENACNSICIHRCLRILELLQWNPIFKHSWYHWKTRNSMHSVRWTLWRKK